MSQNIPNDAELLSPKNHILKGSNQKNCDLGIFHLVYSIDLTCSTKFACSIFTR